MKLKPPKDKLGYTGYEIGAILRKYHIGSKKFWSTFGVNTVSLGEDGKPRYYPIDVERTLAQVLGYRKVSSAEWD